VSRSVHRCRQLAQMPCFLQNARTIAEGFLSARFIENIIANDFGREPSSARTLADPLYSVSRVNLSNGAKVMWGFIANHARTTLFDAKDRLGKEIEVVVAGYAELFGRFGWNPHFCEAFFFFFEDQIDLAGKCHEFLQVLLTRCHFCQLLQTLILIRHPRKL
jgi:hypothetical protein